VPKTVRQLARRSGWRTTVNRAFDEVLAGCSIRPDGTWITPAMREGYGALHRAGHAYSLEVWDGEELIGGLYGVQVGQVFAGESMFHRRSGASKVALASLGQRLAEAGVQILDTQQETDTLQMFGQVLVHRADYVDAVRALRDLPARIPTDERPAWVRP
jgi:leucyl/phenylalanyl-tRNA--protein transferase